MKKLRILLFGATCISLGGMESPHLSIVGQRTGNLDTSCTTTADLIHNGESVASIVYHLRGNESAGDLLCAMGPIAYQNETFLARITGLAIKSAENSSCSLLAFAIKDLKELHEKQNKDNVKNHTLYIDALVHPESYERIVYEFFGFKKVGNYTQTRPAQHVYLLDPSADGQMDFSSTYVPPISSVSIEEKFEQKPPKSDEPSEYFEELRKKALAQYGPEIERILQRQEEIQRAELTAHIVSPNTIPEVVDPTYIDLPKLLDEQGQRTRGPAQKKSTPAHLPVIDPSELPTPIPAAAAPVIAAFPHLIRTVPGSKTRKAPETSSSDDDFLPTSAHVLSQRELRKAALAKLAAHRGEKVRLPRAELLAIQHKTGLTPIKPVKKKRDK